MGKANNNNPIIQFMEKIKYLKARCIVHSAANEDCYHNFKLLLKQLDI
jgi:methanogenic corrinoid protein MtbC1